MDSQVSGTFDSVFDAHNWLFEGTAGQTVQIAATGSGEVDTRIRLIDPDGNLLAEEDDTVGNDPLVSITLPTNGLYTVRVDTWSTGTYSLIVTEGEIAMSEEEAPEDIEPIEMAEEVDSSLPLFDMDDGYDTTLLQLIDINIPYSSTFNSVFDAHNWLFEGSAGQDIQVYATGIDEEVDTRARLIDPDGNLLTEEDDTMGVDPWITITLPDDGLYTVRIDTWSTGAYGMIVMEGEGAAVSGSSSGATIEQWAVRATASSQYTDTDWSASQATGETDTPECGDYDTAWASASATGVEWLQLEYATPVVPTTVVIYETYNPGALYQIDVIGVSGSQYTAYMTSPEIKAYCPMTRSFEIAGIDEKVDTVILYFDQSDHSGWNEIDAVMLIGTE
ncbi:MAG: PPC domain-containing protein [Anaerolineae bacterium]|nr:PPC domain-containing protein [Anaerolineae bacterium]